MLQSIARTSKHKFEFGNEYNKRCGNNEFLLYVELDLESFLLVIANAEYILRRRNLFRMAQYQEQTLSQEHAWSGMS